MFRKWYYIKTNMKADMNTSNSRFETSFRKVCLTLFWVLFFFKLAETFCFINYIDPFAYHLSFARQWYETSFLEALRSNDLYLIAGIFDYLYIIPMMIFKGSRIPSLFMAQSMHFLFSIGLGSVVLIHLFKKYYWAPLSGICLLTISKSSTFFLVAKNDGALSLAVLICFLFIFDDNFIRKINGYKRSIIIGLLLGLIPAIKLNGLLYVAPIGLFYVIKNYRNPRLIFTSLVFSLFLFLPFLIKNWIFIKSPFFPALLSIFPGKASPSMLEFYSRFVGSKLELSHVFTHFKYFFMGKIVFLTSIPLVIFKIKSKEPFSIGSSYIPFLVSVGGYSIYLVINGGLPTYRFIFPGYFLMSYFIFLELKNRAYLLNKYKYLSVLFLLIILSDSKIDKSIKRIKTSVKDQKLSFEAIVERDFIYSRYWKFVETEKGEVSYILSDFLTNSYFAPNEIRVRANVVDRKGSIISSCENIREIKQFKYALLKHRSLNECYIEIENNWERLHTEAGITLYKGRE
jgi:hypothetical protein